MLDAVVETAIPDSYPFGIVGMMPNQVTNEQRLWISLHVGCCPRHITWTYICKKTSVTYRSTDGSPHWGCLLLIGPVGIYIKTPNCLFLLFVSFHLVLRDKMVRTPSAIEEVSLAATPVAMSTTCCTSSAIEEVALAATPITSNTCCTSSAIEEVVLAATPVA